MDDQALDDLSKRVAAAKSRRGIVRALGGAVAVSAASAIAGERVVSAQDVEGEAFGFCRPAGRRCGRDKQCCAGRCKLRKKFRNAPKGARANGRCGCVKPGGSCINRVGLACCSGNCRDGKCQ
jgi:hypothetical protein